MMIFERIEKILIRMEEGKGPSTDHVRSMLEGRSNMRLISLEMVQEKEPQKWEATIARPMTLMPTGLELGF